MRETRNTSYPSRARRERREARSVPALDRRAERGDQQPVARGHRDRLRTMAFSGSSSERNAKASRTKGLARAPRGISAARRRTRAPGSRRPWCGAADGELRPGREARCRDEGSRIRATRRCRATRRTRGGRRRARVVAAVVRDVGRRGAERDRVRLRSCTSVSASRSGRQRGRPGGVRRRRARSTTIGRRQRSGPSPRRSAARPWAGLPVEGGAASEPGSACRRRAAPRSTSSSAATGTSTATGRRVITFAGRVQESRAQAPSGPAEQREVATRLQRQRPGDRDERDQQRAEPSVRTRHRDEPEQREADGDGEAGEDDGAPASRHRSRDRIRARRLLR